LDQVLAPLPIGFAVFVVHLALIPITGTGINPARSLGAAVVKNAKEIWDDHVSPSSYSLASICHKIITFLATVLELQAAETTIIFSKNKITSYATLLDDPIVCFEQLSIAKTQTSTYTLKFAEL
jgi:hypothetical protein